MIRWASCALALFFTVGFAPAAEKELHVIALHGGSLDPNTRSSFGAKVHVDRDDKEVVLIVSGSTAIEWEITKSRRTKLTKVIFAGDRRQSWKVPPGVETDEMSVECVKQRILPVSLEADYQIDSGKFRNFVKDCKQYTGLEISSFQGAYRFDHKKPFTVDSVQNDERLSSDFPKVAPAAQLPKFKFDAVRIAYGTERGDMRRTFGEFTQAGPAADGFVPLPKDVRHIAFDTQAKRYFGTDDKGLSVIDTKLGTSTKIDNPSRANFLPPYAPTFDAKRERVVLLNVRGLYEYATKDGGKWKQLADTEPGARYAALVWQAKTDMLLAFGTYRDEDAGAITPAPTLFELNPDGSVANKYGLGSPLFPSVLGELGDVTDVQLIDLGRDVALLIQNHVRDRRLGWRDRPQSFLYVINPKSGKVQLAWKE